MIATMEIKQFRFYLTGYWDKSKGENRKIVMALNGITTRWR